MRSVLQCLRCTLPAAVAAGLLTAVAWAIPPGEGPALGGVRINQERIETGDMSLLEIRREGRRMFSTPFNHHDGYGDGPIGDKDTTSPGGRPTLQGNGMFLRINGLDAQACLECHAVLSNASIPARFGIGGVGGSVTNAMFQPTFIDVNDSEEVGIATFNGRFINPPFLFGSGGVELLGKEMTTELQALKAFAEANPGQDVPLITKGVEFGVISHDGDDFDTTGVVGVDADLVVRPFGRKGEFPSVRAFDVEAMRFHFGMEPVEAVGDDVDADGDEVFNELLRGELSALSIFLTTLETPQRRVAGDTSALMGGMLFEAVGCSDCHIPRLTTDSQVLTYSLPEVPEDPSQNVYYSVNLREDVVRFRSSPQGGLIIPLYSDLKRHDMGEDLAESFGSPLDSMFITARLWGISDTAPYLHDGRAHTLTDAILMHGGEAQAVRDLFASLDESYQSALIMFLRSLRTPSVAAADL